MLNCGADDFLPLRTAICRGSYCAVIGFGTAAGEHDLPCVCAYERGHLGARGFEKAAGVLSLAMDRGWIAGIGTQEFLEYYFNFGPERSAGVMIEIDTHFRRFQ
jgi:hypothetical protein